MTFEAIIEQILLFFISASNQIIFGCVMLCLNRPKRFKLSVTILIFAAFVVFMNVFQTITGNFFNTHLLFGWLNVRFFITPLFCLAVLRLLLLITFSDSLYYVIAAMVIQHFNYHCGMIILKILKLDLYGLKFQIFYIALTAITYSVLYFVFIRRFKSVEAVDISKSSLVVFSTVTVLIAFAINQWADTEARGSLPYSVMGAIACLCLLTVMLRTFETSQKERDKQIIELLLAKESQKQQFTGEAVNAVNRKYHDLKHEITALRLSANSGEAQKYLDRIEKETDLYGGIVKTGNAVLDTILTEKGLLCAKYKIKFSCLISGEDFAFVDPVDLCSLFGNAVDNAIEYLRTIENEDSRILVVEAKKQGNVLCVTFENYIDKPLILSEDGLIKTTKNDAENHGYGMKSIRFIAEKYGGSMAVKQSSDRLGVSVSLLS